MSGDAGEDIRRRGQRRAERFHGGAELVPPRPLLELGDGEGIDLAEVGLQVHDLVVAEDNDKCAAGGRGLLLETVEAVEEADLVVAVVEEVADLDDGRQRGEGVDDAGKDEVAHGLEEVPNGDKAGGAGWWRQGRGVGYEKSLEKKDEKKVEKFAQL